MYKENKNEQEKKWDFMCSSFTTVAIGKRLSVKNARAWVSMVSYLKNKLKLKYVKRKKISRSIRFLPKLGWIGCAI